MRGCPTSTSTSTLTRMKPFLDSFFRCSFQKRLAFNPPIFGFNHWSASFTIHHSILQLCMLYSFTVAKCKQGSDDKAYQDNGFQDPSPVVQNLPFLSYIFPVPKQSLLLFFCWRFIEGCNSVQVKTNQWALVRHPTFF